MTDVRQSLTLRINMARQLLLNHNRPQNKLNSDKDIIETRILFIADFYRNATVHPEIKANASRL